MLCTLEQVKSAIDIVDTQSDEKIKTLIDAATQAITLRYGREFISPSVDSISRCFPVLNRLIDLCPYDLKQVEEVILNPDEENQINMVENKDFILLPFGGAERTETYLFLKISETLSLTSEISLKFGISKIEIKGKWGAWDNVEDVPADINRAAIETVCAWLDRPTSEIPSYEVIGEPRRIMPAIPTLWDIPISAHRKLQFYTRYLGVF